MRGDDRTPEELERDAEIGRRLQAELPGRRARPDPEPDEGDEGDPAPGDEGDEGEDREDDEPGAPPTLFRPIYQEGGCLDPACLPWWIVVPGAAVYLIARGVTWLLAAGLRRLVHRRDERRRARGWTPRVPSSAQVGPPLRSPSTWADAQRAFRSAYAADPASLPRRPATATWNLDPTGTVPRNLSNRIAGMRSPIGPRDGALVTVVLGDGSGRRMAFEATSDSVPLPVTGDVDAVVVGEVGTNAATCVEVAGGVLWPAYNPVGR